MKFLKSFILSFQIVLPCSAIALPSSLQVLAKRDVSNPLDQGWVKDFAALGDSYAAGIGAGQVLTGDGDGACSRYDSAYAVVMQRHGFGGQPNFKFLACSGDTSENVTKQINQLGDNSQGILIKPAFETRIIASY